MNPKRLASTFAWLLLAKGVSCAPLGDNEYELNLVNGRLDTENAFPSVIQIKVALGDGSYDKCSASIISGHIVLTAAHCLTLDGSGTPVNSQGRRFDDLASKVVPRVAVPALTASAIINGKEISGGKPVLHRGFPSTYASDVAVVVFPKDTFSEYQHMSVATSTLNYPEEGLSVVIVGYGRSNQFDSRSGGEKRFGTNVLTDVSDHALSFVGQTRSTTADGTKVFNSQGDSGGPMIAYEGPLKGQIIGVSSTQNLVKSGDTTGQGNYANLLSRSNAMFLKPYLESNDPLDLPDVASLPRPEADSSLRPDEGRPDQELGREGLGDHLEEPNPQFIDPCVCSSGYW